MWNLKSAVLIVLTAQTIVAPQFMRAEVVNDFEHRVDKYAALHRLIETVLPPVVPPSSRVDVMRATAAQRDTIVRGRTNAREGDIFTPTIGEYFRWVIANRCNGDFASLVKQTEDTLEPLGTARINERWPGATLTRMPPDLREAFPPLPPELEYRFVHRDLVLWDVHVDLIVDVLRDAIPAA